jgi:hypothetical protein
MHGSFFALCNLFLCADWSPEPAIITTRYASFAFAGFDLPSYHQQQSQHNRLGNDFFTFISATCKIFFNA